MTVKHLSVDYNKVNEQGTFSPGDTLSGRVTVVTSGGTKVQCFLVKAKGKAKVTWHEQEGHATRTHRDKRKYFYFEHIFIQDKNKGDGSEIIRSGRNVYPFTFVIPNTDMPSSYEGKWGKIKYSLQAQLTQSIWLVHKTKTEIPFLTKSEFPFASKSETIIIGLKEPQYATRISFSGSAKVVMNVTSEKMGVKQGEAMGVSVEVLNDSARTVTPTFYLCEKQTFAAQSKRIVHTNETLFGTGDPVAAETSRSTTKVLGIPPQLQPTFFNCCMMKLEYRLKVLMRLYSAMHDDNSHRLLDGGRRGGRGLTAPTACLHSNDGYMFNKESYYRPTCSVLFPCADNLLSENQSEAVAPHNDQGIKYRAVMHILFLWVQVRLDGPRDAEIKLPLVILLGSPKPHQQKPKRSIWFLNLPS